jgi:diadenosine tetraphosphatase ApaH/serine/threonine PP2A family protein phosphatase
LEALEACLKLVRGKYDRVLCLGDLVGYGADPNAVIEKIKPLASIIIRGNHDKACSGHAVAAEFNPLARLATEWTRNELTPEHFGFLHSLPAGPVQLEGFQIVHGSPLDEDDYILGPGQAFPLLRGPESQTVCFGHTHNQGGFMISPQGRFQSIRMPLKKDGLILALPLGDQGRYLVNPGSVGQPRDGDWRSACAVFDTGQRTVKYFRVSYDLPGTQAKMRKAGLPPLLIQRLEHGR